MAVASCQYYQSVTLSSASSDAVQHGDEHLLPPKTHVSKPMAPQGKLNEYIIDGHFHRFRQPVSHMICIFQLIGRC
jgi:hypothetical protein